MIYLKLLHAGINWHLIYLRTVIGFRGWETPICIYVDLSKNQTRALLVPIMVVHVLVWQMSEPNGNIIWTIKGIQCPIIISNCNCHLCDMNLRLFSIKIYVVHSSLAFCLNRSVGYAHLAVWTRKPRKTILYLLLIPPLPSKAWTISWCARSTLMFVV